MQAKDFLLKAEHNYWSERPPAQYVGMTQLAHTQPAAFNLAWALNDGQWGTLGDSYRVSSGMSVFAPVTAVEVNDYPLNEWICMMTPQEFDDWLIRYCADRDIRKMVRPATLRAIELQRNYVPNLRRV